MANISTNLSDWSATAGSNQPDSSDTNTIQADLQAIQAAVKGAFPNVTGAVNATHTELNYVDGVTSAIQIQLNTLSTGKASSGANGDITSLTALTNITAAAGTVATDDKVMIQDTSDSDKLKTVPVSALAASDASETVKGIVELATDAETQTGTDTTRAITPANLKAAGLGLGQTWQDVTGSRAFATTYTNTTGKPIQLMIVAYAAAGAEASITLNGSLTAKVVFGVGTAGQFIGSCYAIIPNGTTYGLTITAGSPTIQDWFELR